MSLGNLLIIGKARLMPANNGSCIEITSSFSQSLSADVAVHGARTAQLLALSARLRELVTCADLDVAYDQHSAVVTNLQSAVDDDLCRLLAFRDSWSVYDALTDKLDAWLRGAEKELDAMDVESDPPAANMRNFWVSVIAFFS